MLLGSPLLPKWMLKEKNPQLCYHYIITISIGNNMILSGIWCWETQANFSKTTKLLKPVGQVQFVGPEKFTSAHYTKFAREIMLLLVNNVQPSQARQNFESMCMLFVIYTHVSTLHSYCLRMHSFSVNQKHVIFLHLHYCIDYTCTTVATSNMWNPTSVTSPKFFVRLFRLLFGTVLTKN